MYGEIAGTDERVRAIPGVRGRRVRATKVRLYHSLDPDQARHFVRPGLEVIKLFSCLTQLSMKIQLLIKTKIPSNEVVSCLRSLGFCIYHADTC